MRTPPDRSAASLLMAGQPAYQSPLQNPPSTHTHTLSISISPSAVATTTQIDCALLHIADARPPDTYQALLSSTSDAHNTSPVGGLATDGRAVSLPATTQNPSSTHSHAGYFHVVCCRCKDHSNRMSIAACCTHAASRHLPSLPELHKRCADQESCRWPRY